MFNKIKENFIDPFFKKGAQDIRSKRYRSNSIVLALTQMLSLAISMTMVPLVLGYLGITNYGIWVTLLAIIEWFAFFDIGLGNGLRNKYAEAKSKNYYNDIKYYISTTFYLLLMISSAIFIIFLCVNPFVNWSLILAAPSSLEHELKLLMLFMMGSFCLRFVVNIVSILLVADQQPAIPAIISLGSSVLTLASVYILTKNYSPSIFWLGIVISTCQVLPLVIAFFVLFSTRYKSFRPRIKDFRKASIHSVLSLGLKFFFIQMTGLILFQTNNIIIARNINLAAVTEYNIAYKYMSLLYVIFLTILNPLWSASTEAFAKNDIAWIRNCMRNLKMVWWINVSIGILMVIITPWVYKIWLSNKVTPDLILMSMILVYFLSLTRTSMFRYFMNGVGKIKLQLYATTIQAILHIPLSIFMSRYFGVYGFLGVMILWNIINISWEPVQFEKILSKNARGIWNA